MVDKKGYETVTQEMARAWLTKTTKQRTLDKRHVLALASEMSSGNWDQYGSGPIKLDEESGAVLDGQHRLQALLRLDEGSVLVARVEHVPGDAVLFMDYNRSRSLADTLDFMGFEHSKNLSALYNTALRWQPIDGHQRPRRLEVQWIVNNPLAVKAAAVSYESEKSSKRVVHVPVGVVAALWNIAEGFGAGGDSVVEFVHQVKHGTHGSDMLARMTTMLQEAKSKSHQRSMTNVVQGYLIGRVYAAWLAEEELAKLFPRKSALGNIPGYSEWCAASPIPKIPFKQARKMTSKDPLVVISKKGASEIWIRQSKVSK